jgi:hypothetical protein
MMVYNIDGLVQVKTFCIMPYESTVRSGNDGGGVKESYRPIARFRGIPEGNVLGVLEIVTVFFSRLVTL